VYEKYSYYYGRASQVKLTHACRLHISMASVMQDFDDFALILSEAMPASDLRYFSHSVSLFSSRHMISESAAYLASLRGPGNQGPGSLSA
jgi:hypothetical protein